MDICCKCNKTIPGFPIIIGGKKYCNDCAKQVVKKVDNNERK